MTPADILRNGTKPLTDGQVEDFAAARYGSLREYGDSNFLEGERAFMIARDNVSDDELVACMNAAPDMGGSTLGELSDFLARRAKREDKA